MMVLRKAALVLLIFTVLLTATGCWNRNELNELAVVLAMGIDSMEDGQYEVTLQVVDPSQMSMNKVTERTPTLTVSEHGKTVFEAVRKMTTKASRKMYFAHMGMLVFDETTARKGIREPLDFLMRDHEVRPDFYIAVIKNQDAKYLMQYVSPIEVLPAMDMYKSLLVSQHSWAPTSAVHITELIQKLVKDGVDPVLTGVAIKGDQEKGNSLKNVEQPKTYAEYQYTGIGVFHEDRLAGWLSEAESKAYSYITNQVRSTVGKAVCPNAEAEPGQYFALEVKHTHSKITPEIRNGKPFVSIKTSIDSNIGEVQCTGADLNKSSTLLEFQSAAETDAQNMLQDGINKAQKKYGADIFGIGEIFHRRYPSQWKEWSRNWNEIFRDQLTIELTVEYKLRQLGNVINPIRTTIKKEE